MKLKEFASSHDSLLDDTMDELQKQPRPSSIQSNCDNELARIRELELLRKSLLQHQSKKKRSQK